MKKNRAMKRRWLALGLPIAMVAALTAASMSTSAQAYEGGQALKCNALGTINDWNAQHSLEMTPANPSAGDTVTVTASFDVGPTNGPVALTAGMVVPTADVSLTGASNESIELTGPGMGATPAGGSMPGSTLTGSFVATTGTTTATVDGFVFTAAAFGIVIPCNAGSDPDASPAPTTITESVTVEEATTYNVDITSVDGQGAGVTGYARWKNTVNMDVTGFEPNGTATANTCDLTGGDCDDKGTASTALDANGDGSISLLLGNVKSGARTLSVTDGTSTKLIPITILGSGRTTITPDSGGVGTVVTITGTSFDPGSTVHYGTFVPDNSGTFPPVKPSSDTPASAVADAEGNVGPVTFTVGDAATSYIAMVEGATIEIPGAVTAGYSKFTVNGDSCDATATPCSLEYNLKQAVQGGSLTMARAEGTSTITFSDVTTSDTEQESSAALDTVAVKDLRGGTLGWSLVGSATDLTNASGVSIPASSLGWTPTCGDVAGSANVSTATAGSAASFGGDALTLCNGDQNATAGGPTGGAFEASADLSLTVPPFQAAGDYAGVLTLTLS